MKIINDTQKGGKIWCFQNSILFTKSKYQTIYKYCQKSG